MNPTFTLGHWVAGIIGHHGTDIVLATSAVQSLIVELLPYAIPHLSSTLVETPEQQRQKARMEAYRGVDGMLAG